jgi:hypothetical protein
MRVPSSVSPPLYTGIKFSTQDQQWRGDAFGFGQVDQNVEGQSPSILFT